MNMRAMFRKQAALLVKNMCDQNNFIFNYMHYNNKLLLQTKVNSIIFPTLLLLWDKDMDMCVRFRRGTLNVKDKKAEASLQHCSSETVTQTVLTRV